MILTVTLSLSAGLAFRKRFRGAGLLFYVAIASLIVPSIVTSLGICAEFACSTTSSRRRGRLDRRRPETTHLACSPSGAWRAL